MSRVTTSISVTNNAKHFVEASMNYIAPFEGKPAINIPPEGKGHPRRSYKHENKIVKVYNIREITEEFSLEKQGLKLANHETNVQNFYNPLDIENMYYPEIEHFIKKQTDALEVIVFDHTIRVGQPKGEYKSGPRKPVRIVHNDYTPKSAPQRLRDLIKLENLELWLNGRFAIVQLWQPIAGPVETSPLAIADARTLAPNDLVATDLVYENRTGEVFEVSWNPEHIWYYAPRMLTNEVLIFKTFDSEEISRVRYTAHSAFDPPNTPPDAQMRQSIETRTLVRLN